MTVRYGGIGNELSFRVALDELPDRDAINLLHALMVRFQTAEAAPEYEQYQTACGVVLTEANKRW